MLIDSVLIAVLKGERVVLEIPWDEITLPKSDSGFMIALKRKANQVPQNV